MAVEGEVQETEIGGRGWGGGSCHLIRQLGKTSLGRRHKEVRKRDIRISGGRACQAEGTVNAKTLR